MIHWFRAVLAAAKSLPFTPPPKWEREDARALTKFLESPTGKKLKQYLTNASVMADASAVLSTNTLQHSCGYATGFKGAVAAIQSLALLKFYEEEEAGSDSSLEHLNP